jgi:hypothetical protein
MAENKYDSGTAVVPVYHAGSDEVHNVEVPANTPLADLHSALTDAGYHDGPTEEGALENTSDFRKAARDAWMSVGLGQKQAESAFTVDSNGKTNSIPPAQVMRSR